MTCLGSIEASAVGGATEGAMEPRTLPEPWNGFAATFSLTNSSSLNRSHIYRQILPWTMNIHITLYTYDITEAYTMLAMEL